MTRDQTAAPAVPVAIRYFGPLLDVTGTPAETVELVLPDTVDGIENQLYGMRPGLRTMTYRVAVDETLRNRDDLIEAAREIALLPAFSGG